MFSLQQNQRTRGWYWKRFHPQAVGGGWAGEVAQIKYAHVSKYKNDKIKILKIKVNLSSITSNIRYFFV
jgi:hypothetical protein